MKTIVVALLVLFTACTKNQPVDPIGPVVCSLEQGVASAMAGSVANSLNCTSVAAIQADMLSALGKANLCQQAVPPTAGGHKKGIVGGIVCPLAVDAALGLLVAKVPAAWGCSTQSATGLGAALSAACAGVVPF